MQTVNNRRTCSRLDRARLELDRDVAKIDAASKLQTSRLSAAIAAHAKTTFCRVQVSVVDFLKWTPRGMGRVCTLGDISDGLGVDFSEQFFSPHHDLRDDLDDVLDVIASQYPNLPRRVLEMHRDDIETDLRRAQCNAAESDYEAQFYYWLVDRITSAADDTGAPWVGLDSEGKPSTCPADWEDIEFFVSRRTYLDKGAAWWPTWWHDRTRSDWDNYDTNRERMDAADDVLGEYVREKCAGAVNLEHFDERGAVYADPDLWPLYFVDYGSDTADTITANARKMRATLREMIRNRAPLERRAELVASVYGTPGAIIESEEE